LREPLWGTEGRLKTVGFKKMMYCVLYKHSLVVSALASINVVNRHWAQLLLGWVAARMYVNDTDM